MRVVAYIRCSAGEMQDPERQRSQVRAWAKNYGWEVVVWYEDITGRNPRDMAEQRPQFMRLLRDAEAGKFDRVVVAEQDRWGVANVNEFGYYATRLIRAGVDLHAVKEGDLTNPDDAARPFLNTVSAVTSKESQKSYGHRALTSKLDRSARGEWQGGYVPYGFDVVCVDAGGKELWRLVVDKMDPDKGVWQRVKIEPDGTRTRYDGKDTVPARELRQTLRLAPSIHADRIDTVQQVFRMMAAGTWSVRGICTYLNERGVDPVNGDGWYASRLTPILKNPAYHVGATVYNKNSHGRFQWYSGGRLVQPTQVRGRVKTGRKNAPEDWTFPPPGQALIDKDLFDQVQKALAGRTVNRNALRSADLWLAGLVLCGRCGAKMVGNSQSGCSYHCSNYVKLGKHNPHGCRLHRTDQRAIEAALDTYLKGVGADVESVLTSRHDRAALDGLIERTSSYERELWDTAAKMREYLDRRDVEYPEDDEEAARMGFGLIELYQATFERNTEDTRNQLAAARKKLDDVTIRFFELPTNASPTLRRKADEMLQEADAEVQRLEAELKPLTDRIEAIYADLRRLDGQIDDLKRSMSQGDRRAMSSALRGVVSRIELAHEHYEHKCHDPRAKGKTMPRSRLVSVKFVPVLGDTHAIPVDTAPGRG